MDSALESRRAANRATLDADLESVRLALEVFKFRLIPGQVHDGLDPDRRVAESTSAWIAVPAGKPYRNVYVGVFGFRSGRLAAIRESWNPAIAAESLRPDGAPVPGSPLLVSSGASLPGRRGPVADGPATAENDRPPPHTVLRRRDLQPLAAMNAVPKEP